MSVINKYQSINYGTEIDTAVTYVNKKLPAVIADFDAKHTTTALELDSIKNKTSNVDNTSDINKPISTAQQEALDLKADVKRLERLQYYGNADIVPSSDNIIEVWGTGWRLVLENISKTDEVLVVPYINGKNIRLTTAPINKNEYVFENIKTIIFPSNMLELYGGTIPAQCFPNVDTFVFSENTNFSIAVFKGYTNLKNINIPKAEILLSRELFCGCTSLEKIMIPDSVQTIGDLAFAGCTSLKSVYIPDSVTSIVDIDRTNESGAFYNCPNLTIICNEGSYAERYAKKNGIPYKYDVVNTYTKDEVDELIASIDIESGGGTFPDDLRIKYDTATLQAMYNEVIEPSPEKWFLFDIETKAITGLNTEYESEYSSEDITDLVVPFQINETMVEQMGGALENPDNSILLPSNIKDIRLPNCMKVISNYAFWNNNNIESVNIPTSCLNIYYEAFSSCISLKEVITPIKPNWEISLSSAVFANCSALTNVDTIIDGLKEISPYSFVATGVLHVVIPESVEKIGSGAFSTLSCVTILNPNCEIEDGALPLRPDSVVRGYKGSTAETMANEWEVSFIALDEASYSKDEIDSFFGTKLDYINGIEEEIDSYLGIQRNDGFREPRLYKVFVNDSLSDIGYPYYYHLYAGMLVDLKTAYQYKILPSGIWKRIGAKNGDTVAWSEWVEYATTSDIESNYQPKDLIIPLTMNEDGTISTTVENVYSVIMEAVNEGRNVYVSGDYLGNNLIIQLSNISREIFFFKYQDGSEVAIDADNEILLIEKYYLTEDILVDGFDGSGSVDVVPTTAAVAEYVQAENIKTLAEAKAYTDEQIGEIDTVLDEIIALQNSYLGGDAE